MKFNLSDYTKYSDTLIETGSCYGDGINKALGAGFKRVKSVELSWELYKHCLSAFNSPDIYLYWGKSVDRLPDMLSGEGRCVFFLDAHPAGPGTAGHEEILREGAGSEFDQDTIIKKEIEVILKHRSDHIIIIDDCHGENYLTLIYKNMMPGYTFSFHDYGTFKEKMLVCII